MQLRSAIFGLDRVFVARFLVQDDCGLTQGLPCLISVHRHCQVLCCIDVVRLHNARKLIGRLERCISLIRIESRRLVVLTALLLNVGVVYLGRLIHSMHTNSKSNVLQGVIRLLSVIEGCGRI